MNNLEIILYLQNTYILKIKYIRIIIKNVN